MIDLSTLVQFLAVAQHQNLAQAALELHLTPSAVSKSLKRLEDELRTQLFDREGRSLKLNADGKRLVERAMPLVASAEQVRAEFAGERQSIKCRIAGPALLHLAWGHQVADVLTQRYPQSSLIFEQSGDEATIAAVLSGECDVGFVTLSEGGSLDARLAALPLGITEFRVAIGALHPLAKKPGGSARTAATPIAQVLKHDFVVPVQAPFASLHNQAATDGWRDDVFARKIRYRTDNLVMVQHLLVQGRALAYLPDFAIAALGLQVLAVTGCPYRCLQNMALIHRPAMAYGWVSYLVDQFST